MKKVSLSITFLFVALFLKGQQIEQFSMYMENNFLINPAEAGTTDYVDVKLGYRTQWVGLKGAPQTYFLSVHTPIGKKTTEFKDVTPSAYHGAGVAVVGDEVGAYSRTVVKGSYAYQLPLSRKVTVSAGLHAGIQQYQLNTDFINNARDASSITGDAVRQNLVPDLSFGIWGHTHNFYFGVASFNLIPSKLDVGESQDGTHSEGTLEAHHWLTTGIRIPLDSAEKWNLVPSIVFKGSNDIKTTFQMDLNAKLRYKDAFWLGGAYRHKDAIIGIAGVTLKSLIDIAYSYDFNISKLESFNTGSHEILLGIRLPYHDTEAAPPPFW